MLTITINMPNMPKGGDLEIDGLGVFQNGGSFDITDEQADAFSAKDNTIKTDVDTEGHMTNSVVPGRTLQQAFANHPFITVTVKAGSPFVAPIVTPSVTPVDDGKVGA